MYQAIVQIIIGIAIAVVSAYLTVKLSKKQFKSERWWERKVFAYERVIEAFHHFKEFSRAHLIAAHKNTEIPDHQEQELDGKLKAASNEIKKNADIGRFFLSPQALKILASFESEILNIPQLDTWWDHLKKENEVAEKHMHLFIEEAKKDLRNHS